ncbi:hypothetical protein [Bradyrhizobium valentinum]|uniref:hypothetical protein n=1 Tax=Bradyrhizobium valentinum TaxID=1518501 RepID=UPI0007111966|nr:hypothetical protein [Bradyrhizobium valentinum]KRQ98287.1 hypothetical protein CQ10_27190 [Bradyrhizobium valentinum]
MSDQQPQPTSGETGALGSGLAAPDVPAPSEPAAAEVEAARLAPEQEETSPKPDAPKVEAVKMEAPKVEASKVEAPKIDAPKTDAPKIDAVKPEAPRFPGNVMIMSPGDRAGADAKAAPAEGSSGKRRIGAMAAVVALATVAGALGGALATAGIGKLMAGDSATQASTKDSALEATVARIDADIVALKASLEQTAKAGVTQFNKANDRLDKVEKAQAEPAAKLAKLSETVDKLRTAQASMTTTAAAPAPAKERDVTGTIPQQAAAAAPAPAPAAPPKPEVARLPTVEGWVLRDVANGSALIEGRRGMYEVYAGDPVPGVGRVDAIRKQDGRWVVVTSKGLIVAR